MHQITLFQDKKSKNFLGRGHSPLPTPQSQWGKGHVRLMDDLCFRLLLGPEINGDLVTFLCNSAQTPVAYITILLCASRETNCFTT